MQAKLNLTEVAEQTFTEFSSCCWQNVICWINRPQPVRLQKQYVNLKVLRGLSNVNKAHTYVIVCSTATTMLE